MVLLVEPEPLRLAQGLENAGQASCQLSLDRVGKLFLAGQSFLLEAELGQQTSQDVAVQVFQVLSERNDHNPIQPTNQDLGKPVGNS